MERGAGHVRRSHSSSDAQLVAAACRGSETAIASIYGRYARRVTFLCYHLLGNVADAEDACQQAFVDAWKALRDGVTPDALLPWLCGIARNEALSVARARRRRIDAVAPQRAAPSPLAEVELKEELHELVDDMQRLPEKQREAGGLTHTQIAATIDCRETQAKAFVYQARESLMESRAARALECRDLRMQLDEQRTLARRPARVRRHLAVCEGCREYEDALKARQRRVQAVLPLMPAAAFKLDALPSPERAGEPGGWLERLLEALRPSGITPAKPGVAPLVSGALTATVVAASGVLSPVPRVEEGERSRAGRPALAEAGAAAEGGGSEPPHQAQPRGERPGEGRGSDRRAEADRQRSGAGRPVTRRGEVGRRRSGAAERSPTRPTRNGSRPPRAEAGESNPARPAGTVPGRRAQPDPPGRGSGRRDFSARTCRDRHDVAREVELDPAEPLDDLALRHCLGVDLPRIGER